MSTIHIVAPATILTRRIGARGKVLRETRQDDPFGIPVLHQSFSVYKSIWTPFTGETLSCSWETPKTDEIVDHMD